MDSMVILANLSAIHGREWPYEGYGQVQSSTNTCTHI